MEKHGFKIIDAIRIPNYRGSIRISATLNKNFKQKKMFKNFLILKKKKVITVNQNTKDFQKTLLKAKII